MEPQEPVLSRFGCEPQDARHNIDKTTARRDVTQKRCCVVVHVQRLRFTLTRRRWWLRRIASLITLPTRVTIRRLTAHSFFPLFDGDLKISSSSRRAILLETTASHKLSLVYFTCLSSPGCGPPRSIWPLQSSIRRPARCSTHLRTSTNGRRLV